MKVACPHCSAEYNIDDRRIAPAGINVKCPKCQEPILPHRACPSCGTYKGAQVTDPS